MRHAFTLIELVFVIVIIGIIATVSLPKMGVHDSRKVGDQLMSHIRYTQHLAMSDDKFDSTNATWFRNRWQITLGTSNYSIVSDNNNTFAKDPLNNTKLIQNNKLKNATMSLSGGCNSMNIVSFDHLGRPIIGTLASTLPYILGANASPYTDGQLLTQTCVITLTNTSDSSDTTILNIEPETGYVHIL